MTNPTNPTTLHRAVRRIADLTPGQPTMLKFHTRGGHYTEMVRFEGLSEDGLRATFTTHAYDEADAYSWDAYRFKGRWVYGSSAQPLSVIPTAVYTIPDAE